MSEYVVFFADGSDATVRATNLLEAREKGKEKARKLCKRFASVTRAHRVCG